MSTKAIPRSAARVRRISLFRRIPRRLHRRVPVPGALRRDRVVGSRDGHDPVGRHGGKELVEDGGGVPRVCRLGNALDDVVDPYEDRGELRSERVQLRQLDVDHVARGESVHAEVRDEIERQSLGSEPGDELVRPALLGRPGCRPDRVGVTERDVPQGARHRFRRGARKSRTSRSNSPARSRLSM